MYKIWTQQNGQNIPKQKQRFLLTSQLTGSLGKLTVSTGRQAPGRGEPKHSFPGAGCTLRPDLLVSLLNTEQGAETWGDNSFTCLFFCWADPF